MKTKNAFISLGIILLGIVLLFQSCGPTKPEVIKVDPAFGEYVSAYTSGLVTRKSAIRIDLTKSVFEKVKHARKYMDIPDSTLLEEIFVIEPEIKGKAHWVNDRVVEFVPDEILPSSQLYTVSFDLDRIAEVKLDKHETFRFQFATFEQSLFVTTGFLKMYDYDVEYYYYEGKISTSDIEDTTKLKACLSAKLNNQNLKIRLEETYTDNEYNFFVDSIKRSNKIEKLEIKWDGKNIKAIAKGSQFVEVPVLGDFTATNARVIDREDQKVEINFSEPLMYSQNLNGLITIEGIDNLTYQIENNNVTVYLPNRFEGNKKLSISNGIKNVKGYNMLLPYEENLLFEAAKPLVRIKGNGSILPNSQGLIFPFEAISLKKVDVRVIKIYENNIHNYLQINELNGDNGLTRFGKIIKEKTISLEYDKEMDLKKWNSHVIDLNSMIKAEPGAIYRISIRFNKKYAICDCENDTEEANTNNSYDSSEKEDPNWTEKFWHGYGFDEYDYWEDYGDEYSACDNSYYDGKGVSRNILASDLGLIYKLEENKLSHAFVNDMLTTKPLSNVEIQYFDFTKQLIASGKTDAQGMLEIQLKEKPFLMIAKNGSQRGYLKLADGYTNSLSKFDIKGEFVQKGVKGFIYGERGVWRPGDSLYLNFILENKDHLLPDNHPVNFELQDPNGQVVYQVTKTNHVNSLYDFHTKTSGDAVTGNYTAQVKVGNRIFTKNIKIETVKPNRLKINLDVDDKSYLDSSRMLSAKWLHGAFAKNLHANVNVKISQGKTKFEKYSAYSFDSPLRNYTSEEEVIFDGNLNEKGEASIRTKLNVGRNAPGMLRATYITKVFEQGGEFSIDRITVPYSPFKTYIGIKVPQGENKMENTLETGKNYKFDVVSITEREKLTACKEIHVKVYKIEWRWWYEKDQEDFASYISRSGTVVVKDTIISTETGKTSFNFKVNYPDYGRYIVTASDLTGKHQTGEIISVDWPYWNRGNRVNNENATMLQFSCDKEKYAPGESIKLSFPSASNGRALISVENRAKVLKKFWIDTKVGETTYEFPATKDMAPNAFIHVTLLQPHIGTKNDLPIRMYGIIPVLVDDPNTHLYPVIKMADVLKPESQATIKVKEQNGKKMTYTLALVDDGLLDLTRYQTPQPWDVFYAKEALGVKTWDMYDDVIGAYSGKLNKMLSIGGDGDLLNGKGAKANRFKPMVRHLGPFVLEAGQEKTHVIDIPNYVGSVRVMVVAHQESAYGNAEKTVAVKKPLMILPSLPRVLGPSEEIYFPVNVFAMENHVKNVKISIEVNDMLVIEGKSLQELTFKEIGDEVVNFKLKVKDKLGIAKIKIIATSGNERAVDEIEVDVRASNPIVYEENSFTLDAGKDINSALKFFGLVGSNKSTIEISTIPHLGLEKRLQYVISYPHGCIEQTTSAAFPQLFVSNLMNTNEKENAQISKNVKAALKRIQLFQTVNGGFSYWPGENGESDWGTNYAGHFIIEAEKQGYAVSSNLKEKWMKYQQKQAKNWSNSANSFNHKQAKESHELIQAYRLYVLALANSPELGAMNRLREEPSLSSIAKWRLAGAYALAGQDEVAQKMVNQLSTKVAPYQELSYSYGSEKRDKAMILEILNLLKNKNKAEQIVTEISTTMSGTSYMSTQETAYNLLAISNFYGLKNSKESINFSYKLNKGKVIKQTSTSRVMKLQFSDADFDKKAGLYLKNNGNNKLFVKVLNQGVPLIGDQTKSSQNLNLKVVYKDMKGNEINVDKIKQGFEFFAEVTLTNPGKMGYYSEMVLSQIFPPAWEIHNTRMDGIEESSEARYQDFRDDRVYTYFDLAQKKSKVFKIKLNATFMGKFYLPGIYAEAMYDHKINARAGGKWVEVVKS